MISYEELETNEKINTEHYSIRTYHLDAKTELSIPYLCRFILDSAGTHAYKLGFSVPEMFQHNMTWVLSRFYLRIDKIPSWNEEVIIKTWPSGTKGLFAFREFFLFDGQKNPIGEATSAWLVLDLKTRRPLKSDIIFKDDSYLYPRQTTKGRLEKLRIQNIHFPQNENKENKEIERFTSEFKVRYTDLDLNQHVTSVSYIEWILDTLPLKVRREYHLKELEINFLAEAHIGDRLQTYAYSESSHPQNNDSLRFTHQIFAKPMDGEKPLSGALSGEGNLSTKAQIKNEFARATTLWHNSFT